MNLAYLKNNVIVYIAPEDYPPEKSWDYDGEPRDAAGCQCGDVWDGETKSWLRPVLVGSSSIRELSQLDFQRRFSMRAYAAAKRLADSNTDDTMTYVWGMFDKAAIVHLDDPDTIAGVHYMLARGMLTAEEVASILA